MDQVQYEKQLLDFLVETSKKRPEFENRFLRYPILGEDTSTTSFDPHYIYHVAWALRKLKDLAPEEHIDLSSSLNFCTTASTICRVKFYDFRPATLYLDNLECGHCDLASHDFDVGQCMSLSCMHVVEHIGLGRYGDNLDANGDLIAIENIKKTILPGGDVLFVVPCGKPSISFNAHRVYAPESVVKYFGENFQLQELYFIPGPIEQAPMLNPHFQTVADYDYGCGCFKFRRTK